MSFDRRFKPLGQGLPGPRDFDLSDLKDGDTPVWDASKRRWVLVPNAVFSAFGEAAVAQFTPILELDSTSGLSVIRRDTLQEDGSGTVTEDTDGTFLLSTGTTMGSVAGLKTKERGRYQPGMEAVPSVGIYGTAEPTGDADYYWGYFDTSNGMWFGYDATGFYVQHRHSGTTDPKVYQADWNGDDKLDGKGPSGITLDFSKLTVYSLPFVAYGAGPIMFGVNTTDSKGKPVRAVVHRIGALSSENILGQWKLPVQCVADNGAGTQDLQLHVGGRQFAIRGIYRPEPRLVPQTRDAIPSSVADGTTYPLITMRKKSDAASQGKSVNVSSAGALSTGDGYLKIYLGTTLSAGTTTFGALSEVSADETSLEMNTGATAFTGGVLLKSVPVKGGQGNSASSVSFGDISQILPGDSVNLTFAFENTSGGTADVTNIVLELKEEW